MPANLYAPVNLPAVYQMAFLTEIFEVGRLISILAVRPYRLRKADGFGLKRRFLKGEPALLFQSLPVLTQAIKELLIINEQDKKTLQVDNINTAISLYSLFFRLLR